MQYQKTHTGYILVIDRGQEAIKTITEFCVQAKIKNAYFSAIGAVDRLSCGYYELAEKKYHFTQYEELLEVVSATGNVMLKEERPFIHLHAVFTDTDNQAFGGHVEEMRVGVTLEVMITVLDTALSRLPNEAIGLSLISCGKADDMVR